VADEDIPQRFGIRLEQVRYPFPVNSLRLESQRESLEMAYMDIAPEAPNGRSVVLLHGKNFNGYYWESTASLLAAGISGHSYQIGFGKSSKPRRYQFSFHVGAQYTGAFDHLGIRTASIAATPWVACWPCASLLCSPAVEKLALIDPIDPRIGEVVPARRSTNGMPGAQGNRRSAKQYQIESYYHGDWKPEYERWVRWRQLVISILTIPGRVEFRPHHHRDFRTFCMNFDL
jgi:pimeloyl-ACP methyl ester carboxylesterase